MNKTFGSGYIELVQGDITEVHAEAIVTAANSGLRGGGGVDGAVHSAAGPRLLQACRKIGGCPTGSAVITQAYDLESRGIKYVIHAVGPIWQQGNRNERDELRSAYSESLELARKHTLRSIVFPSISTGVYGFPLEKAAPIAIDVCANFLEHNTVQLTQRIIFCLFNRPTYISYVTALDNR